MKSKKIDFSDWFTEITKQAELCDLRYNVKGFVVFMPWSVKTMKLMYAAYEDELEAKGHRPALFPALIPESNFTKESEHVAGFVPEVLWVTHAGEKLLEEKLAMRPTSETAMYTMYSQWIQGLSDLPLKIYQSCQVWRHETKATRPFIRSREFYWIEAHNVFATEQEARDQVKEDMETSEAMLHLEFGIPFIFFQRPEWDKFPGAVHTFAADTLMPDGKVIQQPSTHLLGKNFAKAFNIQYDDEQGNKQYGWQTCYGPAISRIYASLISIHGDDKGLVLPFDLAPTQVIIVPILKKEGTEKLAEKAGEIKQKLCKKRIRAEADLSEKTPGFKFNEWEMKGVPIRIELGMRELESGELTLHRRDTGEKQKINEDELIEKIGSLSSSIKENLIKKADEWFSSMLKEAGTFEELKEKLESGGLIKIPFCSIDMDGQECAESLKEKIHADVRGKKFGDGEKPKQGVKCIGCGKDAAQFVYVAKQY